MKTEVRRGRKFVEYTDDSLPAGTFVQEIGVHDVSYQDEQGVWLPADENWATDGLDGYIVKADKLNHKVRLKGTGGRAWYPRRNVASEYLTFGIPQYWSRNKWGNFGFSGWSVDGKTITLETKQNVTIKIHSRWNGIKIDWVLNNSNAPVRMRYPVALTGITETDGVLYGADGERLAQLTPTTAIDVNEVELPCSGAYSNGYVEFSVDPTGGMYPIIVDPDYASGAMLQMVYGYNAGYTTAHSTAYGTSASTVTVGQSYLYSKYSCRRCYFKVDTSSIPEEDTITQANLRMTCVQDNSATDFDVQIVKYNWSAQDPLTSNNIEAAFDGCLAADADDSIWRNTNGMSINTPYTSGNLSTEWINKTGNTYYGIRSNRDASATQPTGREDINLATVTHATKSYRPVLIVAYSGGSTAYSLECAAGSYSLTGSSVTLTHTPASQNLTLTCEAGSYTLTGSNADFILQRNYTLSCESGSYALTGTNTALTSSRTLICEPASGGAYPDIIVSGAGTSDANGTYKYLGDWGGKPLYTSGDNSIWWDDNKWTIINAFESGNRYESTENVATPDLVTTWTVGADGIAPVPTVTVATTYTLTGSDVTLTHTQSTVDYSLVCGSGSYTLTGSNVDLIVQHNYTLTLESGSYSLTGSDVTLDPTFHYSLTLESGSYTLTGSDVTLTKTTGAQSYTLVCSAGSYSLTGSDISFVIQRNYTFACEAGSYSLTGTDADFVLLRNYILACGTGSYTLNGTNTALTSARTMALESGSYALTGTNVDLYRALVMACNAGSYALTGSDASLTSHRIFALGMGSYVLVGTSVGLFILTPTPACRTATIEFENRTFAIPHEDRTATIEYENRTLEVKCH